MRVAHTGLAWGRPPKTVGAGGVGAAPVADSCPHPWPLPVCDGGRRPSETVDTEVVPTRAEALGSERSC